MQELMLKSFDKTPIFVTIWDDVRNPKGIIEVSHGMSEYGYRYSNFAKFMNENGYIVFADDHRAHGRTETDKNRGNHKGNVYDKTLNDIIYFYNWLKKKYNLPVFYLGHSYGSFLGQGLAQKNTDIKAIALLGTSYMGKVPMSLASFAIAPLWLLAKNWKPKIANQFVDLSFRYKHDKGKAQWVTRDKTKRQEYINDPYCKIDMSLNFDYYMIKSLSKLYGKKAKNRLNRNCSIDLFCGTADPVSMHGINVKKLNDWYKSAGLNSTLHLYKDDRHEILSELDYTKVMQDILAFFNSNLER